MCEEEGDLLDIFLSTASELSVSNKNTVLKETNIFTSETNIDLDANFNTKTNLITKQNNENRSLVHGGDTDSSDDEDNRNYQEVKYNESGKQIKKLLVNPNDASSSYGNGDKKQRISWKSKSSNSLPSNSNKANSNDSVKTKIESIAAKTKIGSISAKFKIDLKKEQKPDVYTDPVFGIRIVNPLISSSVLQDRMSGRDAVSFSQLTGYLKTKQKDKDWVIAGVIVNKSAVKTSKKGNQFVIWTLSDLKNDIKTISLFLFRSACTELWKTVVGTVVGILNPSTLDKREGSADVVSRIYNIEVFMKFW